MEYILMSMLQFHVSVRILPLEYTLEFFLPRLRLRPPSSPPGGRCAPCPLERLVDHSREDLSAWKMMVSLCREGTQIFPCLALRNGWLFDTCILEKYLSKVSLHHAISLLVSESCWDHTYPSISPFQSFTLPWTCWGLQLRRCGMGGHGFVESAKTASLVVFV